ncbi:hypothetical protein SAMN05660199_03245 [Klenkia soli]|uniref:Glyoxalase-like domain-containing protein n=1 Tax=Klenkia soli TaxID=1052260 RepID=A0A1H0Q886_9ACTN|nr:hypothetical protein SAMN05660199_03245 [Klenkia soli]
MLADPAGARVRLWQARRRPGAQAVNEPGDHLESSVDPEICTRQAQAPDGFEHVIGSLAALPEGEAPRWHVAFTVADRDDAAATAERLGGTVLGTSDTDWTRTATVRDP